VDSVLQEPVFNKGPAITLIVRGAGTGEKKQTDRQLTNQDALVAAIKKRIAETYSRTLNPLARSLAGWLSARSMTVRCSLACVRAHRL
jgi:hypothetical protein